MSYRELPSLSCNPSTWFEFGSVSSPRLIPMILFLNTEAHAIFSEWQELLYYRCSLSRSCGRTQCHDSVLLQNVSISNIILIVEYTLTYLFPHTYSYRMASVLEWLQITWLGKMINAFEASSSILITGLVIFYLQGNRTGFRKTETMINRLIIFSVNTGLLTSIDTALSLIFVCLFFSALVFFFFHHQWFKLGMLMHAHILEF